MRFLRLAALAIDKSLSRTADAFEFTRGRVPPGSLIASVWPRVAIDLARQLKRGSIVFSGVNGKTASGHFLANILRQAGHEPLHTALGTGSLEEFATALVDAANTNGNLRADYGIFGFDEDLLRQAVEACAPKIVALTNLYPDGIFFPGGAEGVTQEWQHVFAAMTPGQTLLVNADDPTLCGGFVRTVPPRIVYFGVEDEKLRIASRLTQYIRCHRCHTPISYRLVSLSHLGDYRCEGCGWERPMPTVYAIHIDAGAEESRFRIITPSGPLDVRLKIPGLPAIYNAVAAAAAAIALGINPAVIRKGLETAPPSPGRGETLTISDRQAHLLLIKNPTSLNESVRTALAASRPGRYLFLTDEAVENGFDLSWVWEAELERLSARTASVYVAGTGALQMAVRLKHAGVEVSGVLADASEAFHHAMRHTPPGERLHVLATDAAMFELRQELAALGEIG
ncbi:MAG: DUF1727 domain-containing protein [candidate division Zixibacteria bacterium]|nr:DUF1727 domain-containing protein [candidate division Zixibacteria bacterium]